MSKIASIIGIDHIGYAVKDMTAAQNCFAALGYEIDDKGVDEVRKVQVAVGIRDGVSIELLAPLPGCKSPLDGYLQKVGSTPYHICYRVSNMETAIASMQDAGFTQLGIPTSSIPLGGVVCFLYKDEVGIVELIER